MHPDRNLVPLLSKPRLDEIERVLADNLSDNWIIRIEHADDVNSRYTRWQQWSKPVFAFKDSVMVLNAIRTCLANHPSHTVRLHAEKHNPRVQFIYWVHRPDYDAALIAKPEQHAPPDMSGDSSWMPSLDDTVKMTRNRLWRIVTVTSMVLASMIVLEDVMA